MYPVFMSLQNALNCSAAMDLNLRRTDQESEKAKAKDVGTS